MTKPKTQFTLDDVGQLYTTTGKDVYLFVSVKAGPEITMQDVLRVPSFQEMVPNDWNLIIGPPDAFKDYVRLVPETDPPARPKRKYERKQAWPEIPNGEGVKDGKDGNVS